MCKRCAWIVSSIVLVLPCFMDVCWFFCVWCDDCAKSSGRWLLGSPLSIVVWQLAPRAWHPSLCWWLSLVKDSEIVFCQILRMHPIVLQTRETNPEPCLWWEKFGPLCHGDQGSSDVQWRLFSVRFGKIACLLFAGCLTSQLHVYLSASQGRICPDNFTCCHTETEVADQTFHLTQSQYTDTGLTSPSADPITPGAWQGSHWSANFEVTGMTRPWKKSCRKRDLNPGSSALKADAVPLGQQGGDLKRISFRSWHSECWRKICINCFEHFASCDLQWLCAIESGFPCLWTWCT